MALVELQSIAVRPGLGRSPIVTRIVRLLSDVLANLETGRQLLPRLDKQARNEGPGVRD